MTKNPRSASELDWKQFLRLGEMLLDQPGSAAQCKLIVEYTSQQLEGKAAIWLAEPLYPLPGEPEIQTLPDPSAPPFVQQSFSNRKICFQSTGNSENSTAEKDAGPPSLALPLIANEYLLGVLQVERPAGHPFTPKDLQYLEGLAAHAALGLDYYRQTAIKNRRYEQLSLVQQVSDQISNLHDLDELCRQVTRSIQKTFQYYYVAIFTLEEDHEELRFRASACARQDGFAPPAFPVRLGQGIIGTVAETGSEVYAPDIQQEPRYRHVDALPETRSEVAIPLKLKNNVLGVLDVLSDQADAFHKMDILVLRALAGNIALAVEGARLYSDLRWQAEQISAVYEVSRAMSSILDLETLLGEVVHLIQKHFGYPFVHIFTVHSGRRKIFFRSGTGERSQAMHKHELSFDLDDPHGIIPWVARNGQTKLAGDVSSDPLYRPSELPPYNTRSEMVIPLSIAGEVLGVLDIQSDQINAFDEKDRFLFETLASSIAIALRNATLYQSESWRRQVADSFRDVASLISANMAIDQLFETILLELEQNLPCEVSAIWLVEEGETAGGKQPSRLRLAAARGVTPDKIVQAIESSRSVHDWMEQALTGSQPKIRRPGDPYGPLGAAMDYPPDYSSIAAPLYAGDKPLGALTLAHHSSGRYGHEARAMTATFANYASVAIQNARLYANTQEQAWISKILLKVVGAGQRASSVEELLASMARLVPRLVGVKSCAFFIREEGRPVFILKSWYGMNIEDAKTVFNESDAPALASLSANPQTLLIRDTENDLGLPRSAIHDQESRLLLLPLLARGKLLGAFLVGHQPAVEQAGRQMKAVLQGIADQIAVGLENLHLMEINQEEAYVTAVLLQTAQAVVSQNEMADILETVVNLMPILVGIDACIVYLWDAETEAFNPSHATTGSRKEEEMLLSRRYADGEFELLDRVRQKNSLHFSPLPEDEIRPPEWSELPCFSIDQFSIIADCECGWLIGLPLSVKDEFYGVLLAQEARSTSASQERRLEIITGIAQQITAAIQSNRLQRERVEREHIQKEIQFARQIQQTFLPSQLPKAQGWMLDARWQPASQVGGDFYDLFKLNRNRLGLVIADVADKGMPAALYMAVARSLIRANSRRNRSPAALLKLVNNQLLLDAKNGMFVTAFYAILDLEDGLLTYANAGHNRPLVLRSQKGIVETLSQGEMALGVVKSNPLTNQVTQLQPGDCLLLYTDGVTEAFSPHGEAFGLQRLIEITQAQIKSPQRLLDRLDEALAAFREGLPLSDDLTLMTVCRNLPPGKRSP